MASIYEKQVVVSGFVGLNQSTAGDNMNLQYFQEAENTDTRFGSLKPYRTGVPLNETLSNPIGTLMRLHRRFHQADDERDVLVAVSGGRLWTKLLDHDDPWVSRYGGLTTDKCDYVTYEVNRPNSDAPTDVLLFTNANDGLFCLYGDDLTVEPVPTPCRFGVLARFKERIWGGAIPGDPDKLIYSAPYNPFDWEAQIEIPEDGAGDILQPSWDGDSFLALKPYGDQLLAFKRNAIWRVMGVAPGDFIMREEYGGGTQSENTVAVIGMYAYMLSGRGIMRYDGAEVKEFASDNIRGVLSRVNQSAFGATCACVDNNDYLVALPLDGSTTNNAILRYHAADKSFTLTTPVSIASFLAFDGRVFYTSAISPGTVFELGEGTPLPVSFVTGYQDLGAKNVTKNAFILYISISADSPIEASIGIRTEKRLKKKTVTLQPDKMHKIALNVRGRKFRIEFECNAVIPWQINSGYMLNMELDHD